MEDLSSQARDFQDLPDEAVEESPTPDRQVTQPGVLLTDSVLRAVPLPPPEQSWAGKVIALVGSKGGCGTTLLTVNVAAELAHGSRVCVIDLAGANGDVAAYLDLPPGQQLAELFQFEYIDGALLDSVVSKHHSKVAVLPQPSNLGDVVLLEPESVARVVDAARMAYDIVLIDCGSHLEEATLTAVLRADVISLVTTPTIPAVRDANRRLKLFDQLQVDRESVRLVVNILSRHPRLTLAQIEEHLAHPVVADVREDLKACAECDMKGLLLSELEGHQRIVDDIARLGEALAGEYEEPKRARKTLASWLRSKLTREEP